MKKTKAVFLPAYNDNLIRALVSMKVEETEVGPLGEDQVLIEMTAAPCNPSDIAFIRGGYNVTRQLPAVPGFEASGTVVDAGANAQAWIGKKVSCFTQEDSDGTWAGLFRANAGECIPLLDGMDMHQAACMSINPLTGLGMFELVEHASAKAFIVNAAGGQVPAFMRVLAKKNGIKVINLVRKEEQKNELTDAGEIALCTVSENFYQELKDVCAIHQPTLAFDAVAGELSGQMLNAMPGNSELIVYGGLSGEAVSGINPLGVIFKKKKVSGFNLNEWLANQSREALIQKTETIQKMIMAGEFQTPVQGTFQFDDAVKGVRTYIKSMSKGKVLLLG